VEEYERGGCLERTPDDFEKMPLEVSGKVMLGDECEMVRGVRKVEN
jgi:hypothetical protein